MDRAGRFGSIGEIGFTKATLLAGVSFLAMAMPVVAAQVIDTDTTITTAQPDVNDNLWIGFNNSGVDVSIDATAGPASLSTSGGNSIYLGVSTASDDGVIVITGSATDTATLKSGDQVFIGHDSDDNTMTLNAYSSVTGTSLVVGLNAGSDRNLVQLLTGTSSIDLTSNLIVGYGGADNDVTLANGADVEVDGNVMLGYDATASGNGLTVSSGSTVTATTGTVVGLAGDENSIRVESGADYKSNTTTLGSLAGADKNSFTVTGAGSTYSETVKSSFNVGGIGDSNSLTVSDGAQFTITDRLAIGQNKDSGGNTATIIGTGSKLHAGNVRVGTNAIESTGNGIVVSDGGALEVAADMKVYGGNSISLSSGAVIDLGTGFETFANSTFALDVDASNAIDFDVTGGSKLAGTFEANRTTGTLTNRYRVLSSTTGVTDNGIVVDDSGLGAGFTGDLSFEGNDLYLVITAETLGDTADLGQNQANLADAVNDAFAGGGGLGAGLVALFGVADGDLNEALSGATGEINAFAQTELGWSGTERALGQLTGPDLCTPGAVGVVCVTAFATGEAASFAGDADEGNHDTSRGNGTLGIGAASLLSPETLVSGLFSVDQTHAAIDELGTADVTGFRFGGSIEQNWQDLYFSVAAVGGLGLGSTAREFSSFTPGSASAGFTQAYFGVRGEIGTDLAVGDMGTVTPFVAADWAGNSTGDFAETGTGPNADLALAYGDNSQSRSSAEIGVRFATTPADGAPAFGASVAYRRTLTADNAVATAFTGLDDYSFDVTPATAGTDQLLLSLDATLPVGQGANLSAQLDASFGNGSQSFGGKLGLFGQW